jgi:hypothetical protein
MPIMLDSDFGGRWRVEGVGCKVERRGEENKRGDRACLG